MAAQIMTNQKVSSLLVTREDKLIGIITDRDLRSRVVAASLDTHLPDSQIMTTNPAQITENRTLFDALALMTERNIHHLSEVISSGGCPPPGGGGSEDFPREATHPLAQFSLK